MRWVVGVLVVRPLESQGRKLLSGSPTLPSSSSAPGEQDLAGALGFFLDGAVVRMANCRWMAWRAEPLESTLPNSSSVPTFEVAFFVGVDVVRARENKLGM